MMVESIPKHLFEKSSILYNDFKTETFGFQDAVKTLGQNERYTGLILSKLVKAGWITKKRDKQDKRIKYYQLKDIHEIMEKIGQKIQKDKR
jgi:DNA-binding MarR family transcriptional regulator